MQRESEGIEVPERVARAERTNAVKKNAAGGKGPWGGHAALNPVLRGWGQYFRTGNAAKCFNRLDSYVWRRLLSLRVKRKERNLRAGEVRAWSREYFENLGLHRLRGTVRYPE